MEYIADRVSAPVNENQLIPWNKLSGKAQNTLRRAIERSVTWEAEYFKGFSYSLLCNISIQDLHDARAIGPARAAELIQELAFIFEELKSDKIFDSTAGLTAQVISESSFQILSKLTVIEDLEEYLEKTASVGLLTEHQRHILLQELLPNRNPLKRVLFGKQKYESALGQLIEANLRMCFAVAKNVCTDADMRARVIAGNLGLLAGITSFGDKPSLDFESYVIKHVREFIQDLIGTHNLSYEDIVRIILGANIQEMDAPGGGENFEEISPFETCANFDELYEVVGRELLYLPKVDERAVAILKHRHQAFGEPELTLDEIGREWGITRERVRQIVDPLMNVKLPVKSEIPILVKAVELFEECEDIDQFGAIVLENKMFSGKEITWEGLWGIAGMLSQDLLAGRIYEKHQELDEDSDANSSIKRSVKKDRSKFGLYDLQVVSKRYEIDTDRAFKIVSEIYPRSIRSGNLVLARTKNHDSMFENSIAKQLKVASPLEVAVLLKGLQRTGKNRDVSLLGTTTELSNLIFELAGNPPTYEEISVGLIKEIEFQALENWLIEIFSEANFGVLHSTDVVNFALRAGSINVSSATVFLLNSPIIRSHGRSLFSLVGVNVTNQQLDDYAQIIRGSSEASEVSYEMKDGAKGILSVRPNLNVITSGIVFPPSGYKQLFEGFRFESFCECGGLETIQAVKFAPSGFWTGFTAMIRHGFSQHQMSKGSTFRFEFDFDSSEVRLLVN
jgi:RNA polymerase sigma factor (sigma-70 family)